MKKTIRWGLGKLSLSPETVRRLTAPELGRVQGGYSNSVSDCENIDETTRIVRTETTCVHHTNGSCQTCR
jgi:hypothetical protein